MSDKERCEECDRVEGDGLLADLEVCEGYCARRICGRCCVGTGICFDCAFGRVNNFVDPFCGMASVLLARPLPITGVETVNDVHGFIPNLWRALREDPKTVAYWADQPVHEADLHAVHRWLLDQADAEFKGRLESDPDFYDAKMAGRWIWGASAWLGSGWCAGGNPWKRRPNLKGACGSVRHGHGVHATVRKIPVLCGSGGSPKPGIGVNRSSLSKAIPMLSGGGAPAKGNGVHSSTIRSVLLEYFLQLSQRLRHVRVTCGDWQRVVTDSVTISHGTTAVLLDPPYGEAAGRQKDLYAVDSLEIAPAVREWALERGDDPRFRIVLCGLDGEHDMPDTWTVHRWRSSVNSKNSDRERLWISPHCRSESQTSLNLD